MAAAAVAAAQPLLQEDSLSQQSTAAAAPPVSGSITASNANGNRNNTPRSTGNPFTAMASSVPGAFSAVSDSVSSAATTMLTQDRMAAIQKFKNDSLAKMRPWKDFFDRNRFSKPANFTQVSNRINVNLVYYFSNYLLIVFGLLIYTLITNLFLTITIIFVLIAVFNISRMTPNTPTPILGTRWVLTQQQAYVFLAVGCVPLLWISSAGSAIFWVVGGSAGIVCTHAAFLEPSLETDFENPV